jgi:hypothetical protein
VTLLPTERVRKGRLSPRHVLVLMLLAALAVGGFLAYAYQWAFYLGGTFHIMPWWQGTGRIHEKNGDYVLYVLVGPQTRNVHAYLETNLTGNALLCTPRGEKIYLVLGGGMRRHLGVVTEGEAIHLYMHHRAWNSGVTNDYAPHFELQGHWRNPNLVMDDKGSLAKNFRPDGTMYHDHDKDHNRVYVPEVVPVTLVPGTIADFNGACVAERK